MQFVSPSSPSPLVGALGGMAAMAAAMGIGRFVYTPILPAMMSDLGQSASDAGLIAAANYAGYLAGALVAGGGWAHGRERSVALAGLAASALLCLAMAVSEAFALFLTIRFAAGVASAFVMIFVSSIVFSALAAAGRSDLQWVHFGGVGTGIASSAVLVAAVSAAGLGWRADWVAAAALSALGLVLVIAALPGRGTVAGVAEREPPLEFTPAFRSILASYALFGFGYIVTATFLIAIMRGGAASASLEAVVWLCTGLAGIPSVYLWGRAVRRFGLRPVIAASCMVEAAGVIASVALGGVAGPVIGGVLLGGTFVAITAFGLQAGRMLAADSPRRALAAMTAAFGTGQILGPVVAGFVADRTGGFFWPSLLAALALVGAAFLALSSRRAQEGLPAASR